MGTGMTVNDYLRLLLQSVADCTRGEYDLTSNNVPRIIFECTYMRTGTDGATIDNRPMKISVVYLASSDQWKAFYPFPAVMQKKEYFSNIKDLLFWLYKMGVDVCY